MTWDNTTLFSDDTPADRAFRDEVREWIARNCPHDLCNRPLRIDPPELKPWHRLLYERGWICSISETAGAGEGVRFRKTAADRRSVILNRASADMCELESRVWLRRRWGKVD